MVALHVFAQGDRRSGSAMVLARCSVVVNRSELGGLCDLELPLIEWSSDYDCLLDSGAMKRFDYRGCFEWSGGLPILCCGASDGRDTL